MTQTSSDHDHDIDSLNERIRKFVEERDWEQYHSPKNLAMAMIVEASELVEIFQWMTEEESHNLEPDKLRRVEEEIADVTVYLMRIADQLNINLYEAIDRKLNLNEKKYPADLVRGQSKKYSEY